MELEFGFEQLSQTKPYVKLLLYGPAGVGKTKFAAESFNPWWYDFENSTETLRYWPEYSHIPVKRGKKVLDILRDVERMVKAKEERTIVIDSMTTCHDQYLREYVKVQAGRNSNRDPNVIYEGDYKYATQVFTDLFGILANAPLHVILIGHRRVIRNEQGTITDIFPDITPRLQEAVIRLVNVVGYMDEVPSSTKESKRLLHVKRTPIIEAKNRLNIQKSPLENTTFKELFADIEEIPADEYEETEP